MFLLLYLNLLFIGKRLKIHQVYHDCVLLKPFVPVLCCPLEFIINSEMLVLPSQSLRAGGQPSGEWAIATCCDNVHVLIEKLASFKIGKLHESSCTFGMAEDRSFWTIKQSGAQQRAGFANIHR